MFGLAGLTALLSLGGPLDPQSYVDRCSPAGRVAAAIPAPRIPRRVFAVRYMAKGGDARGAIQAAIDRAAVRGGRVVVPAGRWLVKGPLHLRSRVELHLSDGATLLFSADPDDYLPVVKMRWEGAELMGRAPLIYAAGVHDAAITGRGVIDGNPGSGYFDWEKRAAPDTVRLYRQAFDGVPLAQRVYGRGTFIRPSAIAIVGGARVLLSDFTVRNASFWVIQLVYADGVVARGLTIDSHQQHNDGIDVDSSRNVLIEHNSFRTGNYSVALKSGRDLDGRRISKPSENVVIRDNVMAGGDGVGFGSESAGGIRHVYILRNSMANAGVAFHFKSNLDRGGVMEDIHVCQMSMGRYDTLVRFNIGRPGAFGPGEHPTAVRDITFSGLRADGADTILDAFGAAASPISGLVLSDVIVNRAGRTGTAVHATSPRFDGVYANGKRVAPPGGAP